MNKFHILLLLVLLTPTINASSQVHAEISKYFSQNKFKKVIVEIDQKLTNNPNNPELLFLKAQSQSHLKRINDSITTYLQLIKAHPSLPEPYNNLAALYSKQGRLELAVITLKRGLATTKIYLTLHDNIDKIHFEMARTSYNKALGVDEHKSKLDLSVSKNNSNTKNVVNNTKNKNSVSNKTKIAKKTELDKKLDSNQKTRVQSYKYTKIVKKKVVKAWNVAVISTKDEIVTALQGWAAAWSAQDFNLYLSFYSKAFSPENGQTTKRWKLRRQARLVKPRWIEVRLSNFNISNQTETSAEVDVIQIYRSNNFRDKSKKKILLQRSDDGWQILSELSLQE